MNIVKNSKLFAVAALAMILTACSSSHNKVMKAKKKLVVTRVACEACDNAIKFLKGNPELQMRRNLIKKARTNMTATEKNTQVLHKRKLDNQLALNNTKKIIYKRPIHFDYEAL